VSDVDFKNKNRSKNNRPQGTEKSTQIRKKNKKENKEFQWKRAGKTSLVWVLIIISAVFLSNLFTGKGADEVEIQYTEYRTFLKDGLIAKARVVDEVFHGELSEKRTVLNAGGISQEIIKFRLKLPFVDREVMNEWDQHNVDYTFKQKSIDWTGYFLNILPWIAILAFWIFIMRRIQGGGGGMKSFLIFSLILKQENQAPLIEKLTQLKKHPEWKDIQLATAPTPWEWEKDMKNFIPLFGTSDIKIRDTINSVKYIKICRFYSLASSEFPKLNWADAGLATWKTLSSVCAD